MVLWYYAEHDLLPQESYLSPLKELNLRTGIWGDTPRNAVLSERICYISGVYGRICDISVDMFHKLDLVVVIAMSTHLGRAA